VEVELNRQALKESTLKKRKGNMILFQFNHCAHSHLDTKQVIYLKLGFVANGIVIIMYIKKSTIKMFS
jgi:hypothetical protein